MPERFRLPYDEYGIPDLSYDWYDRPDHNRSYPEIAVPLELVGGFDIAAAQPLDRDIHHPRPFAHDVAGGTPRERAGLLRFVAVEFERLRPFRRQVGQLGDRRLHFERQLIVGDRRLDRVVAPLARQLQTVQLLDQRQLVLSMLNQYKNATSIYPLAWSLVAHVLLERHPLFSVIIKIILEMIP